MELEQAINAARAALEHWSAYLEENDREDECAQYDNAADVLDQLARLLAGRKVDA